MFKKNLLLLCLIVSLPSATFCMIPTKPLGTKTKIYIGASALAIAYFVYSTVKLAKYVLAFQGVLVKVATKEQLKELISELKNKSLMDSDTQREIWVAQYVLALKQKEEDDLLKIDAIRSFPERLASTKFLSDDDLMRPLEDVKSFFGSNQDIIDRFIVQQKDLKTLTIEQLNLANAIVSSKDITELNVDQKKIFETIPFSIRSALEEKLNMNRSM